METMRAKKRRPTHPGEILREDVLPTLGLTQLEFANPFGCIPANRIRAAARASSSDSGHGDPAGQSNGQRS